MTVSAAASRDCVWAASSESSWLQVSPATGQGNATLTIVAAANASADLRIGAIIINDVHLTVTQGPPPPPATQPPVAEPSPAPSQGAVSAPAPSPAPAPTPAPTPGPASNCSFTVSPRSASYGSSGGAGAIAVTAASGCAWTASASNGWIDITSGERGTGSGLVRYEVTSHKGKGDRTGSITVAGTTVTITQAGKD